jgi:hypothetical protein
MRLIRKISTFPLFGVFSGIFPLIALWNINKSQINTRDVSTALILTILFDVIFVCLLVCLTKNTAKANYIALVIFVFFYSYGHVYELISQKQILGFTIGYVKLLVAFLIAIICLTLIIIRTKSFSNYATLWLNIVLFVLIVGNLFSIISYNLKKRAIDTANTPALEQVIDKNDIETPDIYYIILDAYSRPDVLQDLMGYDDSEFTVSLLSRGFYIADCSSSNYDGTLSSMTSSLNFEYLPHIGTTDTDDLENVNRLINNNIRKELTKYGYTFVTSRGFSSENDIPNSDIYLDFNSDPKTEYLIDRVQFTRLYLNTTLFRVFFELYDQNPLKYNFLPNWLFISSEFNSVMEYALYWFNQTNFVFDSVDDFPQKPGNYFVYAHFNIPHGPYVFDENGEFRYTYNPVDNVPYYLDQVTYVNKRVIELIDDLIINSTTPPIIILQSDHGAHVITTSYDHTKILNAYYLPENAKVNLYETITPVNTFRIILKYVFSQDINLLVDEVYIKELNDYQFYPNSCDLGEN